MRPASRAYDDAETEECVSAFFMQLLSGRKITGYRTFCVFFNANGASVYRASLAFIFSEMIFEGGQKVL